MNALLFQIFNICWIWFGFTQALSSSDCNAYFSNHAYPFPKGYEAGAELVKLCQNMQEKVVTNGVTKLVKRNAVFATLYDTNWKIPLYSASKLRLTRFYTLSRPNLTEATELWDRQSEALCKNKYPGLGPMLSNIREVPDSWFSTCEKYQSSWHDYKHRGSRLTRGHLEPRNTNNDYEIKQRTTFTLTNAAPQYKLFNEGSWERIECLTREMIFKNNLYDDVYIITGVSGRAKDNNNKDVFVNKRVKVPGYFWKAVCFPGNQNKQAWGYAVKLKNKDAFGPSSQSEIVNSFQDLKTFNNGYFKPGKSPFSDVCLRTTAESTKNLLNNQWQYYKKHCFDKKKKN